MVITNMLAGLKSIKLHLLCIKLSKKAGKGIFKKTISSCFTITSLVTFVVKINEVLLTDTSHFHVPKVMEIRA